MLLLMLMSKCEPALNQGCMSFLEYGCHVGQLQRRRRCCRRRRRHRRVYAPTSNTASHDNHEKINSLVSFSSA